MNDKRKKILWIIAGVIALMVLFPPYMLKGDGPVVSSGYSLLFDMPEGEVEVKKNSRIIGDPGTLANRLKAAETKAVTRTAQINVGALSTQVLAVLIIGAVLYRIAKE